MEHHVHIDAPLNAEAPSVNEGPMVTVTAKAVEMARQAMQREGAVGHALRIGVVGGGCSGFQYNLGFEPEAKSDDTVVEVDGLRVLIDPESEKYLRGIVLDYVAGLHGAGFKFLNPNAARTCGCGSSFSA